MKKLLIVPLLTLLTGCVTYYYPQTALEDGVYYAEDDPTSVPAGDYYVSSAYYPWWSLDHFYLGYGAYPGYGFRARYYGGYGYYGSGFSMSIGFGYSPWHPYYYPYSPWYGPYYYPAYGYGWRPYHTPYYRHGHRYYGRHHYRGKRGYRGHGHGGGHDRYSDNHRGDGSNRDNRGHRGGGNRNSAGEGGLRPVPPERYENKRHYNTGGTDISRYVSTAPAGQSGNNGLEIRSRGNPKPGKSQVQPVRTMPFSRTNVSPSENPGALSRPAPATGRTTPAVYSSRHTTGEVRYNAGGNKGRTHTGPVRSTSVSAQPPVASRSGPVSRPPTVSRQTPPPAATRSGPARQSVRRPPPRRQQGEARQRRN